MEDNSVNQFTDFKFLTHIILSHKHHAFINCDNIFCIFLAHYKNGFY